MNICSRGHDRDVLGTDKGRHCSECRRQDNRDRMRRVRERDQRRAFCRNGLHPKPAIGECEPCRAARNARYKPKRRVRPSRYVKISERPVPVDGLEPEFGPCPVQTRSATWVDRVALARTVAQEPVGRALTVGEVRALHLLKVMRGDGSEPAVAILPQARLLMMYGSRTNRSARL